MTRKFKLEWINVSGVDLGYTEVWDINDLKSDFNEDKRIMRFSRHAEKGDAYIVFDNSGTGFLILTRVSNYTKTTAFEEE